MALAMSVHNSIRYAYSHLYEDSDDDDTPLPAAHQAHFCSADLSNPKLASIRKQLFVGEVHSRSAKHVQCYPTGLL